MKPKTLREMLIEWADQYDWTTITNIGWLLLFIGETAGICWLWWQFWIRLLA